MEFIKQIKSAEEFSGKLAAKSILMNGSNDEITLGSAAPVKGVFIEMKDGRLIDQKDWSGSDGTGIKGIYVSDGVCKVTLALTSVKSTAFKKTGTVPAEYPGHSNFSDGRACMAWIKANANLDDYPAFKAANNVGGYVPSMTELCAARGMWRAVAAAAARLKLNNIEAEALCSDTVYFFSDGTYKLAKADKFSGADDTSKSVSVSGIDSWGDSWGYCWSASLNNEGHAYGLDAYSAGCYFTNSNVTNSDSNYGVRPAL